MTNGFHAGTLTGKYLIEGELGRGGMGVVYLAADTQLHRKVALKVLSPALAQDPSFVENFRREAQIVASAYHPNIVHVHSMDVVDGQTIIDMEYVDGGTLARHVERGRLDIEAAIRMASEVLGALDWCHSEGLVHRDIKPSNILFDRAGRARVADFGLAGAYAKILEKAMRGSASSGILWGTPRYAPPEAWDGAPPSPAWDVFATGVVLYESVTGQPPFDTSNPLTALKEMAHGPRHTVADLAPDTPAWFSDLIHAMLAADPAERSATAREALGRLQGTGARSVSPILDTPIVHEELPTIPSPSVTRKPSTRAYRRAAMIAVICTLVIAGAAAWFSIFDAHDAPVSQADAFAAAAPRADTLAALVRDANRGAWSVFDAEDVDGSSGSGGSWYVMWREDGTGEAVVQSPLGLCMLDLTPGPDGMAIGGNWAAYLSADGSRLDAGVADGVLKEIDARQHYLALMRFQSQVDGARWERNVYLSERGDGSTDTGFLAAFEEHALMQPLLYNDLDAAGFPWALRVDAVLPALAASRCNAVRLPESVEFDHVWETEGSSIADAVEGRPWSSHSRLWTAFNDTTLLIGATVPASLNAPRFRLALLPRWYIPLVNSPRYMATLTGGGIVEQRMIGANSETAWDGDLIGSLDMNDGAVTAVIAVPFAALGYDGPPSATERWRLNAVLENEAGMRFDRVAEWGWPAWERVEHGVVVTFDAR